MSTTRLFFHLRLANLSPIPLFVGLLQPFTCDGGAGMVDRASSLGKGLVGYWMLQGDRRDRSGNARHGVNRGVNLADLEFTRYFPFGLSPKPIQAHGVAIMARRAPLMARTPTHPLVC